MKLLSYCPPPKSALSGPTAKIYLFTASLTKNIAVDKQTDSQSD